MKLFLNNLLKGLLTALVVVSLGGFISLNIKIPPTKTMVLVSSSLVNSIKTEDSTNVIEIADENEEEIDVQIEENIESNEDEKDLDSNEDTEDQVIESDNTDNSNSSSQETNTPVQEPSQEENTETEEVSVKGEYAPNLEVVNTISPIETYLGKNNRLWTRLLWLYNWYDRLVGNMLWMAISIIMMKHLAIFVLLQLIVLFHLVVSLK